MSKNNSSKNLLMQGSILAVASIIVRFIGLLYRVPMNNILGESGMGLYSMAYEIYNLGLILSSYSLPLAVSKMVSAKIAVKEYNNRPNVWFGVIDIFVNLTKIFPSVGERNNLACSL